MTHQTLCGNQWIHDLQNVIVDYIYFPRIFPVGLVIYFFKKQFLFPENLSKQIHAQIHALNNLKKVQSFSG